LLYKETTIARSVPRVEDVMTEMQEVLFKTDKPTEEPYPTEFYELSLESDVSEGKETFVFREKHGYWDPALHRIVIKPNSTVRLKFQVYRDGLKAYVERLNLHISRNFLHSFIWHPANGEPSYNQKLEKRQ
jgi:hypothetical protein